MNKMMKSTKSLRDQRQVSDMKKNLKLLDDSIQNDEDINRDIELGGKDSEDDRRCDDINNLINELGMQDGDGEAIPPL